MKRAGRVRREDLIEAENRWQNEPGNLVIPAWGPVFPGFSGLNGKGNWFVGKKEVGLLPFTP